MIIIIITTITVITIIQMAHWQSMLMRNLLQPSPIFSSRQMDAIRAISSNTSALLLLHSEEDGAD